MNEPLIPNVPFLPREAKDADDLLRWSKEVQEAIRENYRVTQKRLEELNLAGPPGGRPAGIGARRLWWDEETDHLEHDPDGAWRTVGDAKPAIAQGRLTLQSTVAVPTADQSAKGTLYYAPYNGNKIALIDTTSKNMFLLTQSTIVNERGNSFWTAQSGATISLSTSLPWRGSRCLSVVTPGAVAGEGARTAFTFTVTAAATYTASVYVRGAGNLEAYVNWTDAAGTTTGVTASVYPVAGTLWQRVVVSGTAPAGTVMARLYVITRTGVAAQPVTFYLDGAQFEAGSSATDWVPGRTWKSVLFAQKSVSLAAAVASKCYDVWGYLSGGLLALEIEAWTNATTRATGLTQVDGVWTRTWQAHKRYLGTFYCYSNGLTSDAQATRYLFNCDNRVSRRLYLPDGTAGHYYNGAWRYWNNNGYPFHYVDGLQETVLSASVNGQIFIDAAGGNGALGLGPIGAVPTAFFDVPLLSGGIVNSAHMTYQSTLGLNSIYAWEMTTANALFDWETLFGAVVI